jgi:transposase InsO family protein
MSHLQHDYPVSDLARTLDVTSAGFYAHQHKPERLRRQEDARLAAEIQPIFLDSRKTYGSPRICAALRHKGQRHGRNRIARLMRQNQWRARQKRRYRPRPPKSILKQPTRPTGVIALPPPPGPKLFWVPAKTSFAPMKGGFYMPSYNYH